MKKIKQHKRAIILLTKINQRKVMINNCQIKIEIEKNKPSTKSFLFYSEKALRLDIEKYRNEISWFENRYNSLINSLLH